MAPSSSGNRNSRRSDTRTIEDFIEWLGESFPRLSFRSHVPLSEITKEPGSLTLQRFRTHKWTHADVVVYRHGKPVCIIEPGGFQHITDDLQVKRDAKKYLTCKQSGLTMLSLMNSSLRFRNHPKFRRMLKKYFYSNT